MARPERKFPPSPGISPSASSEMPLEAYMKLTWAADSSPCSRGLHGTPQELMIISSSPTVTAGECGRPAPGVAQAQKLLRCEGRRKGADGRHRYPPSFRASGELNP